MSEVNTQILCPVCGKEMERVNLESANMSVDICVDGCGGVHLDSGELTEILTNKEAAKEIMAIINFSNSLNSLNDETCYTDSEAIRYCPTCQIPMTKTSVGDENIVIDQCCRCNTLFIDNNEIEKIINIV